MFKDQKEALRRLEAELLNEEYKTLDEELDEAYELLGEPREDAEYLYRNFSNGYGRENAVSDSVDTDTEDYDEDEEELLPQTGKSSLRGLIITAMVLLAAIFCVLAFWAVRYL